MITDALVQVRWWWIAGLTRLRHRTHFWTHMHTRMAPRCSSQAGRQTFVKNKQQLSLPPDQASASLFPKTLEPPKAACELRRRPQL